LSGTAHATAAITDNGNSREFPSMTAYRCAQHGHVFFVAEEQDQT